MWFLFVCVHLLVKAAVLQFISLHSVAQCGVWLYIVWKWWRKPQNNRDMFDLNYLKFHSICFDSVMLIVHHHRLTEAFPFFLPCLWWQCAFIGWFLFLTAVPFIGWQQRNVLWTYVQRQTMFALSLVLWLQFGVLNTFFSFILQRKGMTLPHKKHS